MLLPRSVALVAAVEARAPSRTNPEKDKSLTKEKDRQEPMKTGMVLRRGEVPEGDSQKGIEQRKAVGGVWGASCGCAKPVELLHHGLNRAASTAALTPLSCSE